MEYNDKTYDGMRKRIFDLLENEPISQKEFATIVGVSPQTITDWKSGKSNSFARMIPKIAYALRTTTSWLFDGTGPRSFLEARQELMRRNLTEFGYLQLTTDDQDASEDEPFTGMQQLSSEALLVGAAYDNASPEIQTAVRRVLGLP